MPRVLFINHPEADFGGYFLWNGLWEIGCEVVDYPWKASYHGIVHEYPSLHETWTPAADPNLTAKFARGIGVTAPYDFAIARPGHERSLDEISDLLSSRYFDVVVLESPRKLAHDAAKALVERGLALPRAVVHDAEDSDSMRTSLELANLVGAAVCFKRELLPNHVAPVGMRFVPFPLSSVVAPGETPAKDIDVLCSIGLTHAVRSATVSAVTGLSDLRVDIEFRNWYGYIGALRRSKIAVAPRGFGWDTVRRWEAPSCTCTLIQRLAILDERPLIDGEHCVYWNDASELPGLIRRWLADDAGRERIDAQGRAFIQRHHTTAARARRMLEVVAEVYG